MDLSTKNVLGRLTARYFIYNKVMQGWGGGGGGEAGKDNNLMLMAKVDMLCSWRPQ